MSVQKNGGLVIRRVANQILPHDTYFLREANLYVDVDSHANIWTSANFAKDVN